MNLDIVTEKGKKGQVEVSDAAFTREYNEGLVHQVVTAYLAGGRQGTRAQKTRSEVRGGGRKPWRQKGTGRARAGTIRSPIWRSGGVTFAAKPQDFSQRLNKKMYKAGQQCIFAELVRSERLVVLDKFDLKEPKTKQLVAKLKKYDLDNVLLITSEADQNVFLASRNIPNIDVRDVSDVDPVSLISYDKVAVTVDALKQIEERLA